jgi:hypothetical protein
LSSAAAGHSNVLRAKENTVSSFRDLLFTTAVARLNCRKDDRLGAQALARLARIDPQAAVADSTSQCSDLN